MQLIATSLTGSEIVNRLRQGHVVRRPVWQEHYYTRICNESGFDQQGNAIFDERQIGIYTLGSDGYFTHLGFSAQPFPPEYVWHANSGMVNVTSRQGEGMCAFFADDWEDYGFMTSEEFNALIKECSPLIRTRKLEIRNAAADAQDKERIEDEDDCE